MTYQFKVQIKNITNPPVWRRLTIPSHFIFYDFHLAIQVAFGWFNNHLFQFSPKGYGSSPCIRELYEDSLDFEFEEALDAEKVKLSEIFYAEKQKFTYIYDFGDDWKHTIILENIIPEITMYPKLLAGKGKCPLEDCGGTRSYENIKEVLSDKKDPEYDEMAEWCGLEENEKWNPFDFNLSETQKLLLKVYTEYLNDK